MKLFLSSYQIGNDPGAFVDLLGGRKRVALIMNAADPYGPDRRPFYLEKFIAEFNQLGLELEDFDLRIFYGSTDSLSFELERYDAIWVSGGNTFALRWAMAKSGFDKWLPKIMAERDMVYGGFSAGACVVTPTLRGIHLTDDPEKVPIDELQWDGLSLVNFCIAPHYRSDHPESPAIEKVVEYFQLHNMKYHTLHDGEAIRVIGNEIKKVGRPNSNS